MDQPLYPNFLIAGSAIAIVSNIFEFFPYNTVYQHTQSDDVLQYPIWEGTNRLTSPLLETLSVDSFHSSEFEGSSLLRYQSINIRTSNLIHNIFNDCYLITTNENHIHPPTNLVKLPIFDGMSFECLGIC